MIDSQTTNPPEFTFDELLVQGGLLLSENRPQEAKVTLERALHLAPEDAKCLNLLGLTYFRLRDDVAATEVYRKLVASNPGDATLYMNLGLVYLRMRQVLSAIEAFESAIGVDPHFAKAHLYLAKACAQNHDYLKAQRHYELAGETDLAEKMATAHRESGLSEPLETGSDVLIFDPAAPTSPGVLDVTEPSPDQAMGHIEVTEIGLRPSDEEDILELHKVVRPSVIRRGSSEDLPVATFEQAVPVSLTSTESVLAQAARDRLLEEAQAESPFLMTEDACLLQIDGSLHGRLEGWVCNQGDVASMAVDKVVKGKPVDESFGEGSRTLFRLTGHGTVYLDLLGRHFEVVSLGDETAFFRESVVAGFESSVLFENGHMAGDGEGEWLDLVGLSGPGKVLIELDGTLKALQVQKGKPVSVALRHLIGWMGDLQPSLHSLSGPALQLVGEGYVLLALPKPSTR